MTANGSGLAAVLEIIMSRLEMKPRDITDDEVKNKSQ
jgi:hypothetical protein